jgi:hypothetical protein
MFSISDMYQSANVNYHATCFVSKQELWIKPEGSWVRGTLTLWQAFLLHDPELELPITIWQNNFTVYRWWNKHQKTCTPEEKCSHGPPKRKSRSLSQLLQEVEVQCTFLQEPIRERLTDKIILYSFSYPLVKSKVIPLHAMETLNLGTRWG